MCEVGYIFVFQKITVAFDKHYPLSLDKEEASRYIYMWCWEGADYQISKARRFLKEGVFGYGGVEKGGDIFKKGYIQGARKEDLLRNKKKEVI